MVKSHLFNTSAARNLSSGPRVPSRLLYVPPHRSCPGPRSVCGSVLVALCLSLSRPRILQSPIPLQPPTTHDFLPLHAPLPSLQYTCYT